MQTPGIARRTGRVRICEISVICGCPKDMTRIAILGSTGSIGTSALDVARTHADRIEVVPNGVEAATDPVQAPGSADVLVIARHARNKNLNAALEGFACFLRLQPSWEGQLLLVGHPDRITPQLRRLAQELGLQGRVQWIDGLSEPALEELLRKSFCLLSCSLMEGFDYPLLEAQARGIPTLASRIPVHCELHRDHALLFEVGDGGASLGGNLQQLARDSGLWQQLSQAGPVHAQQYSLCRQVKQIAELLASIQP